MGFTNLNTENPHPLESDVQIYQKRHQQNKKPKTKKTVSKKKIIGSYFAQLNPARITELNCYSNQGFDYCVLLEFGSKITLWSFVCAAQKTNDTHNYGEMRFADFLASSALEFCCLILQCICVFLFKGKELKPYKERTCTVVCSLWLYRQ